MVDSSSMRIEKESAGQVAHINNGCTPWEREDLAKG